MKKPNIIEYLCFDRATSVKLDSSKLIDSQRIIIGKIKEFEIDSVYFSTDNINNSYPAVFLKKVDSFDSETLRDIANTHKKIWNYKKVIFLYVYTDTEIRIYNCAEKPLIISSEKFDYQQELRKLEIKSYNLSDKERLKELNRLFSSIAIDTGIIWTIEEAESIRKKISIQRRVDKYLVESLIRTAKQLQTDGLKIDFIHKIIMRSLFLLYLEDRGATNEEFYSKIRKGATSYFDILNSVEDTYALFNKLEYYFNGNVFTLDKDEKITEQQLQLIKNCFISGYDGIGNTNLFPEWRLFNFKIIQIELLSEIYEKFLLEINPELKRKTGTHYTPPSLVELILNEKLPVNNGETEYNVKTLDPACGSGIFLVESFKRLVKRYENKHNNRLTDFNKLKRLLTENIFGIEINNQAVKVAAFSLYLALIDELDPKTFWKNKDYRLPYLINDPTDKTLNGKQGNNLFCRDTIDTNNEIENIEFDLVVGNPPFGNRKLLQSIRDYCEREGFAKEMVLPFLHKATQFSKNGDIALIFNTKVLTNTGGTYQKFRKWLFNECYVEKIFNFSILRNAPKNFGGQLFGSATGPISIVFYKKNNPKKPSKTILYYAPKTFIKSNVIEGVTIDSTDVKYLPREECQKPDTKIWKIAMWGNSGDINLIKELSKTYPSLKEFFKNESIDYGVGFELSSPKNKIDNYIKKLPIHNPSNILKYYTPKPKLRVDTNKFYRLGKIEAYKTNHILLNEGVKVNNKTLTILSSYVDYSSAYSKGIVGIFSTKDDFELLKLLTIYLNSDFVKYFAFLTTSTWGIERDVVKHLELFEVPYLLFQISEIKKKKLLNKFSNILSKDFMSFNEIKTIENEINTLITSELSTKNKIVINHLLDNIDLFHKKDKSKFLLPVLNILDYTKIIKEELNNFLEKQNLYANTTTYKINRFSPLMMIKISFCNKKEEIKESAENLESELKKIDKKLWKEKATNIYFRKKLNYKTGNDIYIIRPNQRRFWSKSMALEDASKLILEILNDI